MLLFPWLHHGESISNFENSTFFVSDAILDFKSPKHLHQQFAWLCTRSSKNRKSAATLTTVRNMEKRFFFGVSWCGATSMTDMTMIFYFPHLWSWRKLQNKKLWNFDLFWMICGATCVEKWPICRILWRNGVFFWGQKSGEKVKNGIFCLFQTRFLWSFYKWYS